MTNDLRAHSGTYKVKDLIMNSSAKQLIFLRRFD